MTLVATVATVASKALAAYDIKADSAVTLAAGGAQSAEDWAQFANELAELEGAVYAYNALHRACGAAAEVEWYQLAELVLRLFAEGADDGWSGRTNDVRRARFDGIRTACANVRWTLEKARAVKGSTGS